MNKYIQNPKICINEENDENGELVFIAYNLDTRDVSAMNKTAYEIYSLFIEPFDRNLVIDKMCEKYPDITERNKEQIMKVTDDIVDNNVIIMSE